MQGIGDGIDQVAPSVAIAIDRELELAAAPSLHKKLTLRRWYVPGEPAGTADGSPAPAGRDLAGAEVIIVGDVLHSRVARSNVLLLTLLGVSEEAETAATRWVFGHGDLRDWPEAPACVAALLADPAAAAADLRRAVEPFSDMPDIAARSMDWRTTSTQAARLLSQGALEGRRALRLSRAAPPVGPLLSLPNIDAADGGAVTQEFFVPGVTLADVMDDDGGSFIVHADADDYVSQPAGNAGDRIACGVIQPSGASSATVGSSPSKK